MSSTDDSTKLPLLPEKVFKAELDTIIERRKVVDGSSTATTSEVRDDLSALCISGGGIRSATYSLGVIQSLAAAGYFKNFDYLSTVSGGGYTGSMLSNLLNDPECDPDDFPLAMPEGGEEPPALQHLRNHSNYLNPGGLLNVIRLPAVVLRGLLLNFLMILPFIMLLVTFTEIVHEREILVGLLNVFVSLSEWLLTLLLGVFISDPEALQNTVTELIAYVPLLLLVALLVGGYLLISRTESGNKWQTRNRYEMILAIAFLSIVAFLLIVPLNNVVQAAIQMPWERLKLTLDQSSTLVTWGTGLSLFAIAFISVMASQTLSKTVGQVFVLAGAIVGPGLLFAVYLLLLVAQVDSPFMKVRDGLPLPVVHNEKPMMMKLNDYQLRLFWDKGIDYASSNDDEIKLGGIGFISCGESVVPHLWLIDSVDVKVSAVPKAKETACVLQGATLERWLQDNRLYALEQHDHGRIPGNREYRQYKLYGANLQFGGSASNSALMSDTLFFYLAMGLLILNYFRVNVNQSSLHGFYRDRLALTFLMQPSDPDDPRVSGDVVKLSSLNRSGTYAPYHVINTTLNAPASTVPRLRGRRSDTFMFSKHYCGGPLTDYCETNSLEKKEPHLNLGTAMAISGAAASPNMGTSTIGSLVFFMTLLNARLGYWMPNPKKINEAGVVPQPSMWYLGREALSLIDENSHRVLLTDGAHFENLAVYEMLRRRCRTIVCLDGESDPDHTFEGLTNLLRLARIDLGVEIEIDLDGFKLDESRCCREHIAVGTIKYGDDHSGQFIYVKSSFVGEADLPPYMIRYRNENPAFPQESTADQFFDELQFEAYRAHGEYIGRVLAEKIESGAIKLPAG